MDNFQCEQCNNVGYVSDCCGECAEELSNGRYQCFCCFKFCTIDYCERCDFYENINVGDEVDLFICNWSNKNITKYKIFKLKGFENFKYETVKIIKFIDMYQVIVRHPKMKKNIKVYFEDLTK